MRYVPPNPVLQTPRKRPTKQTAESRETSLVSHASTALYNDDGMPIVDFEQGEEGDVDAEMLCATDATVPIEETMAKLTTEAAAEVKNRKGCGVWRSNARGSIKKHASAHTGTHPSTEISSEAQRKRRREGKKQSEGKKKQAQRNNKRQKHMQKTHVRAMVTMCSRVRVCVA